MLRSKVACHSLLVGTVWLNTLDLRRQAAAPKGAYSKSCVSRLKPPFQYCSGSLVETINAQPASSLLCGISKSSAPTKSFQYMSKRAGSMVRKRVDLQLCPEAAKHIRHGVKP